MNEFEFLRGLPFGGQLPAGSPLLRIDPRARLLAVLLLVAGLTATPRPAGAALGLAAALLGSGLARLPLQPLLRGLRAVLPFLLILALLQVAFQPGGATVATAGPLAVTGGGLLAGLALLLRFSGLIVTLSLAAAALPERDLTAGLERLLHPLRRALPVRDLVLVVQVTLRFFPLLAQSAERIAKAQAARGADWRPAGWNLLRRARQIIPLIVPLFITSLRRAERVALAMDARGYDMGTERTQMVELRFTAQDALVVIAAAALAGVMVFGSF